MKLSEQMERALLEFFARDENNEREFLSLSTVHLSFDPPREWREKFIGDVVITDDKESLKAILEQMVIDGLLQRDWKDGDLEASYRATEQGVYESVFGFEGYITTEPSIEPIRADAEDWTGSSLLLINAERWRDIRNSARAIQKMSREINYYSDSDRQDIQNLSDALVLLCEMAEPDVTIIQRLTSHPKFKIYAGLFAAIATIRGALGL